MSLNSVVEMASNPALRARFVAQAAKEKVPDPEVWVEQYIWTLVARPDMEAAWDSAVANWSADPGEVVRPVITRRGTLLPRIGKRDGDPGSKEDVITDEMIRAAVGSKWVTP